MAENKRSRCRQRPRVALIIESSFASGRGMFCGIAEYVRQHGPWSIYSEPRGLEEPPPAWLADWRGDGIIARLSNRRIAAAVVKSGIPAVDMLGIAPQPGIPVVHPDDRATGRLAAEHLLERGLRQFGFCGVRANWSQRACAAFVEAVTAAGCRCQVYELPLHGRLRPSWESDQERLARCIRQLPKPAGIMACSDSRAQRVLEACGHAGRAMRLRATPFVLSSATPRVVLDGRRRHADFGERSPRPKAFHGPKQTKNGPIRRFTLILHMGRLTRGHADAAGRPQPKWDGLAIRPTTMRTAGMLGTETLTHYMKGEPLQGVVNPSRGYSGQTNDHKEKVI